MRGAPKRGAAKRGPPSAQHKKPRRKGDDGDDAYFLADDEEQPRKQAGEEESDEEEARETADQLRLRLAREYLAKLQAEEDGRDERRGVTGGASEDEDEEADGGASGGEDEDEDAGAGGAVAARSGGSLAGLSAAERAARLAERLQKDVASAQGRLQRRLADRLRLPPPDAYAAQPPGSTAPAAPIARCVRGHRLAATCVALAADGATAYTGAKDGSLVVWDVERAARKGQLSRPGYGPAPSTSGRGAGTGARAGAGARGAGAGGASASTSAAAGAAAAPPPSGPDWVARRARAASAAGLAALAVSDDGRYVAAGGGDAAVHVWDGRSGGGHVASFPGHKDAVTGLAFREGTHTLVSCSADRTIKLWSLDDRAYMDTLYGHQAEVLSVDVLRAERVLSGGHDHTCRLWKIPEESQLIFRAHDRSLDCVRFVTPTEWVTGGSDGCLHLWSHLKKKPVFVARAAHGPGAAAAHHAAPAGAPTGLTAAEAEAAGAAVAAEAGWLTAVAVCRGSDLVASGAGDGAIRLWGVRPGRSGGAGSLECVGALPQRGFVNGLALSRSGHVLAAAVGQEPRLGRWARDARARNGLAVHRLTLAADG